MNNLRSMPTGGFVVILIIVVSLISKSSKQNKRKQAHDAVQARLKAKQPPRMPPQQTAQTPQPAAEPAPIEPSVAELTPQVVAFEDFDKDGSIEMPVHEPHEHEGKPMPCPAEEREKPRVRPSQQAPQQQAAAQPALQLNFSQDSLVQATIMAEILKRPEFRNGRRVIR